MLRRILDSHPNISCGPEAGVLQEFDRFVGRHPDRLDAFGVTAEEFDGRVRDMFSWMNQRLAERNGKQRWAHKTPSYALRLDYIDRLYPDCQVVHVVRDPLDVMDSLRRKHGFRKALELASLWPSHVRGARSFGATHPSDRYFEIRYEELVCDPETRLRALFSWLGEPWDPAVLRFRRGGEWRQPTAGPAGATSESTPATGAPAAVGVATSSVGVGRRHLRTWLIASRVVANDRRLVRELRYR